MTCLKESRDNWGTLYPPEEKDPPDFGEEMLREEQYHVAADWLIEMEEYNEFMAEEDYEVDEKGEIKAHEVS